MKKLICEECQSYFDAKYRYEPFVDDLCSETCYNNRVNGYKEFSK